MKFLKLNKIYKAPPQHYISSNNCWRKKNLLTALLPTSCGKSYAPWVLGEPEAVWSIKYLSCKHENDSTDRQDENLKKIKPQA